MKKFLANNIYRIEFYINHRNEYYCYGKDMEIIPETSLLKLKKPFKKHERYVEFDSEDRILRHFEPIKGRSLTYSEHGFCEMVLSQFKITDMKSAKVNDWINRSWTDISKLTDEARANYLKLSRWERFKLNFRR